MSGPRSVAEILRDHVTLAGECIDRMDLTVDVPRLQTEGGVAYFFRAHRGHPFASSALMAPISQAFIRGLEAFAAREGVPLLTFAPGQAKDAVMAEHLARFPRAEGVVFIGTAQEETRVFRTEKRKNPRTGQPYPWLVRATAMVNHYYIYGVDRDFGPFFLKFCSSFSSTAKRCRNGHESVKRQLAQRGIPFEPLDNGLRACADPRRLQALCDGRSAAKLDALFRQWLHRLPHPFTPADRQAGYRSEGSLLQAEFALPQVLHQPRTGRLFFEQGIREHLDLGRPDQVALLFGRRVTRRTPGRFRTRVLTEGVTPSLHLDYQRTRIQQAHTAGQALRTETTINHAPDFGIGKRLGNLAALRQVGFQANRRLLDVQQLSHDCALGDATLQQVERPQVVADPRVQALLSALVVFRLLPASFAAAEFRQHVALLLGLAPGALTPGRVTSDLRRLRLHGLIARLPKTHRYQVTPFGLRLALFVTRVQARLFRPGVALLTPEIPRDHAPLRAALDRLERVIDPWCTEAKLVA